MPGEVWIHVDVKATGHYRFRVRSGKREIITSVNPDLAASFYEDLRLLRWKSAGIHDQGDILLNHVGNRVASLVAPEATWEELGMPNGARHVRVQFSQAAHRLMSFPWELIRVNDQFLIGASGSHLVREVPAPAGKTRRRNPVINVLHVSLGTDSTLRFDEERCTLLETIPVSIPIEFLVAPSRATSWPLWRASDRISSSSPDTATTMTSEANTISPQVTINISERRSSLRGARPMGANCSCSPPAKAHDSAAP